jgi:peptidoglycan/LPS O-acetylase OafA/YrhL
VNPDSPRYVRSLDSLRAVAALLVVLEHTPLSMKTWEWAAQIQMRFAPGYLGVDLFFVLSGFLITRILMSDRAAGVPLRWFWARRALRIFPAFYLLTAIVAVVRWGPEIPWVATYLSNFYFYRLDVPFSPLSHTWSLAVEEHFYLLWPLLVYLLPRRLAIAVTGLVMVPVAAAVAYWVARYGLLESMSMGQAFTPIRMFSLALGGLLAFGEPAYQRLMADRMLVRFWSTVSLAVISLAAINWGYLWYVDSLLDADKRTFIAVNRLVGMGGVALGLVTLTILADRIPKVRWLDPPFAVLRYVGRISYGLYLYHLPVFFFMDVDGRARAGELTGWDMALAVALSFAAAIASYHLVERPIMGFAKRFRRTVAA